MKVLFDHRLPFLLAHGGFQNQILQTMQGLKEIGVDVDFLRWWDQSQQADIIHYFGSANSFYIDLAQRKGIKSVLSELRTGLGSRPRWAIGVQRLLVSTSRRTLPRLFLAKIGWDVHPRVDAAIALTEWEKELLCTVYGASSSRTHVIPNGVDDVFFEIGTTNRTEWLVCTATITQRKRIIELARAAVIAKTPLWIVGEPYSESDSYYQEFLKIAQTHSNLIRYEGAIHDRRRLAEIYRSARAFVLVSTMETLSLSALEAAASGCPLLLTRLPWATVTFENKATYCPNTSNHRILARALREFYDADHSMRERFVPLRWRQVAEQTKAVYEIVLSLDQAQSAAASR